MRENKYQRITAKEALAVRRDLMWVIRVEYENGIAMYYQTSTLYDVSLTDFFSENALIKEIKFY